MKGFPHGLPPEAKDPSLFAHGLAVFCGTPYFTFERAFATLKTMSTISSDDDDDDELHDETSKSKHRRDVHQLLTHLVPDDLIRTPRLSRDLLWFNIPPTRAPDVGSAEEAYAAHIRQVTSKSPVTLVAYAWTMYMAIFAGGRYIREDLSKQPAAWWDSLQNKDLATCVNANDGEILDRPGFSFLSFDGPGDGEALLAEFRQGMNKADKLLTKRERKMVVKEAQKIFEYGIQMVAELDAGHKEHHPVGSGLSEESLVTLGSQTKDAALSVFDEKSRLARGDILDQLERQEQARDEARELRNFLLFRRVEADQRKLLWFLWIRFIFWTVLLGYGWMLMRWLSGNPLW